MSGSTQPGGINFGRWTLPQGESMYWAGLNQGQAVDHHRHPVGATPGLVAELVVASGRSERRHRPYQSAGRGLAAL